ncbi:hypothetical protein AMS68_004492 [Peltaster fructicola]|uniref:Heterokaryon incompatibility domain-containing protein n=1 Tax=Peltaster fructicola TaxID=286661 RepID=A0A6H0XWE1_9PEZI|nr:hypothetical protein AMS68_004492 [Peltaster fructicola]
MSTEVKSPSEEVKLQLEQWYKDHQASKGGQSDNSFAWPNDQEVNNNISWIDFEQRIARATQWQQGHTPFCCSCVANFEAWPTQVNYSRVDLPSTYTLTNMMDAAEKGCKSCSFGSLNSGRQSVCGPSISLTKDSFFWEGVYPFHSASRTLGKDIEGTEVGFRIRSATETEQHYDMQPDTLSIARQWLANCRSSHTMCHTGRTFKRPSRILSIAGTTPRVQPTSPFEIMPHYATLSYTWGCDNFLKLTGETLADLSTAIAMDALPKTFVEAIDVAKGLAIDYIWIDALCIIQGSEADWMRESSLMRDIYGGAVLNIAANSSTNVHKGGLRSVQSTRHQFTARVKSEELVMVKPIDNFETYGCLRLRAWTLQERLLATRNLYMGDRGVHWHCQALYARQDDPTGTSNPNELPDEMMPQTQWSWAAIAAEYSHASLTFGKDRLPALAGIARLHAENTGDTYIVGMWKRTIVRELCWLTVRSSSTYLEWRAPSWSWLSVDTPVFYSSTDSEMHARLCDQYASFIDVDIKLTGDDTFGPITAARLQLAYTALLSGNCTSRQSSLNSLRREVEVTLNELEGSVTVYLDWDHDTQTSVYLLPLISTLFSDLPVVHGIALLPSQEQQDCFKRIGYFQSWDWWQAWYWSGGKPTGPPPAIQERLVHWLESRRVDVVHQATITLV